jgi:predicted urease superfamily metal-dependent hydrolase
MDVVGEVGQPHFSSYKANKAISCWLLRRALGEPAA